MNRPIPPSVIDDLIAIGRDEALTPEAKQSLSRFDWINRQAPDFWYDIAGPLDQSDLTHLIKGAVITERELCWSGGSVAGAVWLYRCYEEQYREQALILADWIFRNRGRNDYLPFGRRTSAKSHADWDISFGVHRGNQRST